MSVSLGVRQQLELRVGRWREQLGRGASFGAVRSLGEGEWVRRRMDRVSKSYLDHRRIDYRDPLGCRMGTMGSYTLAVGFDAVAASHSHWPLHWYSKLRRSETVGRGKRDKRLQMEDLQLDGELAQKPTTLSAQGGC